MYDLSSFYPSLSIYTEQNETEKWMIRRDLRNRNWKSWEIIDWIKHDLQVKSTNMQSTEIQCTHSCIIKVRYHLSFSLKFAIIVSYCKTILITMNEELSATDLECDRKIVCQGHSTKRYVSSFLSAWDQRTAWNRCVWCEFKAHYCMWSFPGNNLISRAILNR